MGGGGRRHAFASGASGANSLALTCQDCIIRLFSPPLPPLSPMSLPLAPFSLQSTFPPPPINPPPHTHNQPCSEQRRCGRGRHALVSGASGSNSPALSCQNDIIRLFSHPLPPLSPLSLPLAPSPPNQPPPPTTTTNLVVSGVGVVGGSMHLNQEPGCQLPAHSLQLPRCPPILRGA